MRRFKRSLVAGKPTKATLNESPGYVRMGGAKLLYSRLIATGSGSGSGRSTHSDKL